MCERRIGRWRVKAGRLPGCEGKKTKQNSLHRSYRFHACVPLDIPFSLTTRPNAIFVAPHKPAPHPCAPPEIQESFQSFLSKLNSSSSSSSSSPSSSSSSSAGSAGAGMSSLESTFKPTGKKVDYENYWEAPAYLWEQKEVTEREMECVMVRSFLYSHLLFLFSHLFISAPLGFLHRSTCTVCLYFAMAAFLTFRHHLSLFKFSPLSLSPLNRTKKKKLTSSRSYLNSLAVQQILGRDLKMCIAKSRNSNVQTIEEEQDAYSYGLP